MERGQITAPGRPAGNLRSAGVPPAMTNAGKMPALHRGIGLKAVRESGSAGVPPAHHEPGRPARHHKCGQDARAPKRRRPKRCPRIWEPGRPAHNSPTHREAPSTKIEIRQGIETATRRQTPGLQTASGGEGPSTGLRIGRYHVTTKGREIITALCRSQHVTMQQLNALAG